MKKISLLFCLLSFVLTSMAGKPLHIMTFNIRYNNPGDGLNAWPERKDKAASQIAFHDADIIGLQEALYGQLNDLVSALPGYEYVGGGRDDGHQKGEYSAILYNSKRLNVLETSMFWLSQTPTVAGSKGWDADYPRVVTWAKFKDSKTKKVFYAFNTHFDHMGKEARRQSALMLLKAVDSIAGTFQSIITGDFNAKPGDEPIQLIVDNSNPLRLTDTKLTAKQGHYGPKGTFNNFESKEIADEPIDYIFTKGSFTVLKHATLSQSWQGRFSSDHFPVYAEIIID